MVIWAGDFWRANSEQLANTCSCVAVFSTPSICGRSRKFWRRKVAPVSRLHRLCRQLGMCRFLLPTVRNRRMARLHRPPPRELRMLDMPLYFRQTCRGTLCYHCPAILPRLKLQSDRGRTLPAFRRIRWRTPHHVRRHSTIKRPLRSRVKVRGRFRTCLSKCQQHRHWLLRRTCCAARRARQPNTGDFPHLWAIKN